MVSTELLTGRGIVVMVVGSGRGDKSPRMIIWFSKTSFQNKKGKRDDKVSRLQVAATAYHTHSRSPISSSTMRGGLL